MYLLKQFLNVRNHFSSHDLSFRSSIENIGENLIECLTFILHYNTRKNKDRAIVVELHDIKLTIPHPELQITIDFLANLR